MWLQVECYSSASSLHPTGHGLPFCVISANVGVISEYSLNPPAMFRCTCTPQNHTGSMHCSWPDTEDTYEDPQGLHICCVVLSELIIATINCLSACIVSSTDHQINCWLIHCLVKGGCLINQLIKCLVTGNELLNYLIDCLVTDT